MDIGPFNYATNNEIIMFTNLSTNFFMHYIQQLCYETLKYFTGLFTGLSKVFPQEVKQEYTMKISSTIDTLFTNFFPHYIQQLYD